MSSESEEPKKPGPPPPDIKPPASVPPPTRADQGGSSPPPKPPMNVRIKDEDQEESGAEEEKDEGVPLNTRLMAAGIDWAIGVGLMLGVSFASAILPDFLGTILSNLGWPLFAAFIVLRDGLPFLNGQSPGKSAMKIKAVTVDGQSLSGNWPPAAVRNVVLLIPLFAIVELVILLTREDKPERGIRLGDEWAKTRVVRAEDPAGDAPAETDEGNAA